MVRDGEQVVQFVVAIRAVAAAAAVTMTVTMTIMLHTMCQYRSGVQCGEAQGVNHTQGLNTSNLDFKSSTRTVQYGTVSYLQYGERSSPSMGKST